MEVSKNFCRTLLLFVFCIINAMLMIAFSERCTGDYKNSAEFVTECHVIEGRLVAYLSDIVFSNSTSVAIVEEIKSIMEQDLLDDSHPAILSVIFMTPSLVVAMSPVDDNLFEEETIDATGATGSIWIMALAGIFITVFLASVTRYRYFSQFRVEGPRDSFGNSEDFLEVDSNTSVMAYIDVVPRKST